MSVSVPRSSPEARCPFLFPLQQASLQACSGDDAGSSRCGNRCRTRQLFRNALPCRSLRQINGEREGVLCAGDLDSLEQSSGKDAHGMSGSMWMCQGARSENAGLNLSVRQQERRDSPGRKRHGRARRSSPRAVQIHRSISSERRSAKSDFRAAGELVQEVSQGVD
jgi:hypothetical protein